MGNTRRLESCKASLQSTDRHDSKANGLCQGLSTTGLQPGDDPHIRIVVPSLCILAMPEARLGSPTVGTTNRINKVQHDPGDEKNAQGEGW